MFVHIKIGCVAASMILFQIAAKYKTYNTHTHKSTDEHEKK